MNKRHVFLLAVISMICQVTMADGYTDLYILPADASLPMENITLTNISNITFNNGQMNIMTTDSNVKTYQLSQVHTDGLQGSTRKRHQPDIVAERCLYHQRRKHHKEIHKQIKLIYPNYITLPASCSYKDIRAGGLFFTLC